MLMNMATTWESLVVDREAHIARQKRMAVRKWNNAGRAPVAKGLNPGSFAINCFQVDTANSG